MMRWLLLKLGLVYEGPTPRVKDERVARVALRQEDFRTLVRSQTVWKGRILFIEGQETIVGVEIALDDIAFTVMEEEIDGARLEDWERRRTGRETP